MRGKVLGGGTPSMDKAAARFDRGVLRGGGGFGQYRPEELQRGTD